MSAVPASSAGQAANQTVAPGATTTTSATTGGTTSSTTGSGNQIFILSFPPGTTFDILDGSNWSAWSSLAHAILRLNNARHHLTEASRPPNDPVWDVAEEKLLGMMQIYTRKDVWLSVADDSKFPSVKTKWEELKRVYGGVGAMSTFNSWMSLTSTKLDENAPFHPQIQKLNDTRRLLEDNNMTITDLQYCFILLKALPDSYSTVASTILAASAPDKLTPKMLTDRFENEEGRRVASDPTSLNKIAPVQKSGDKSDKSKVKCYYCQKPGHKRNVCRKKKRDEEAEDGKDKKDKDKDKSSSSGKSVNTHIVVPTTATITEIADDALSPRCMR